MGFIILAVAIAAQPGAVAPERDPRACAPVVNRTAAGRRPPMLRAMRDEREPQQAVELSVHRCWREVGGYRVERRRLGARYEERAPLDWVPAAQCPALGRWIDAVTRLRLPMTSLHEQFRAASERRGTRYSLHGLTLSSFGHMNSLEIDFVDPPGAPPNALSGWIAEGERIFQSCRDRGHGGEGMFDPLMDRIRSGR